MTDVHALQLFFRFSFLWLFAHLPQIDRPATWWQATGGKWQQCQQGSWKRIFHARPIMTNDGSAEPRCEPCRPLNAQLATRHEELRHWGIELRLATPADFGTVIAAPKTQQCNWNATGNYQLGVWSASTHFGFTSLFCKARIMQNGRSAANQMISDYMLI